MKFLVITLQVRVLGVMILPVCEYKLGVLSDISGRRVHLDIYTANGLLNVVI